MKPLSELGSGREGVVTRLEGGQGFRHRVETMGIRIGKRIRVVAKHPWGPIVVDIGGCQVTMGRGMANKVIVEE
ncbi:MAG: ferrous iron transport protein A [Archaeoglobaceae archaeon]